MDPAINFHNQTRNTGNPSSGFDNEAFSPFNFPVNSTQDYANASQQNISTVQSIGFNTNYDSRANYGIMEPSGLQNNQVTFIDRKTGTEYNAEGKPIIPPTTGVELNQQTGAAQITQTDKQVQTDQPTATWYPGQTDDPWYQPYLSDLNHQTVATHQPGTMQQPYLSGHIYLQSNNRPFDFTGPDILRITSPNKIRDYFPLSVIVTIFCCWPIGVCALSSSRKIPKLKLQGKCREARDLSQEVLALNILGIFLGVLIIGGIIGLTVWRMNVFT